MADQNLLDFRTIFNKSQVMMHYADMNNIIIAVNEYWLNKMEYSAEEVLGKFSAVFLTKDSQDYILKHFTDLFQEQTVNDVEVQAVTKSGKIIDLIFGAQVVFGPDGKPQGFMATSLDVTSQKQTQKALKMREIYLTAIIENQPGLVWLKNAKNQFLAVNQMFAHSCEKNCPEDLIGKTDLDIWPKELAEKYRADDAKLMENRVPIKIEEVIMDEGERRWFETYKTSVENNDGDIIGTTGYAHDITDRKLREEALHNMQKLESLGILAGGIAHDFNNLLSGIFNSIDIALLLSKDDEVKDVLSNAKKVIHRSRGLT